MPHRRSEGGASTSGKREASCSSVSGSQGEERIRKSLKTTDKRIALVEAERLTLDAKAAQSHERRVISSSVAEAIADYEELQMLRLTRSEIRSECNIRFRVGHLRKVLGAMFGLERPIGSLSKRD